MSKRVQKIRKIQKQNKFFLKNKEREEGVRGSACKHESVWNYKNKKSKTKKNWGGGEEMGLTRHFQNGRSRSRLNFLICSQSLTSQEPAHLGGDDVMRNKLHTQCTCEMMQ